MSQTGVSRIWRVFGLEPTRPRLSSSHPIRSFIDKVRDISAALPEPASCRVGQRPRTFEPVRLIITWPAMGAARLSLGEESCKESSRQPCHTTGDPCEKSLRSSPVAPIRVTLLT